MNHPGNLAPVVSPRSRVVSKKRVLLTGAAGYISSQLLPAFRDRYELVLLDIVAESPFGQVDGIIHVDLTDPNLDEYREHFKGVDAIVHNGFYSTEGHIASAPRQWVSDRPKGNPDGYYAERTNLDMVFHLFKLAQEENIPRLVITGSNHAADWYESIIHHGKMDMIGPDIFPLSDNFYGWGKASHENLGFIFATGRFGDPIENVHIRIGGPRPFIAENHTNDMVTFRRELGAYISERDLQQMYIKSIETADIRNTHGIPHQIFYGISRNSRAFWSIINARQVIGYEPDDDSELIYAEDIRRHLTAAGRTF